MDKVTLREYYLSLVQGKPLTVEQGTAVVEALLDLRATCIALSSQLEALGEPAPQRVAKEMLEAIE